MDSIASNYLAERNALADEVLGGAATVLAQAGDPRAAASLQDVLHVLHDQPRVLDEPVPGLSALLRLAGHERLDPRCGVLPGERVRLVFSDGAPSITGAWCYDEPTEEWPAGRTYVVRDDTGEEHAVSGGGWVQVKPLWFDLARRDRAEALARALTVIGSAWAEPQTLRDMDPGDSITHDHIDYEQGVDPSHSCTERQRHCHCGKPATLRVTAWALVESTEHGATDEGPWARQRWYRPEEYGSETVCSQACAEGWVDEFRGKSMDTLGEKIALTLRYNLEAWSYTPRFDDLPGALALSRESASMTLELASDAAEAWFNGEYEKAAEDITAARTAATTALARIAELEPVERGMRTFTAGDPEPQYDAVVTTANGTEFMRNSAHGIWMPTWSPDIGIGSRAWHSLLAGGDVTMRAAAELLPASGGTHPRDITYEAWLQMAASLVVRILDDPHRYEIHGGGDRVYDRQLNRWHDGRTGKHTTPPSYNR